MKKQIQTKQDEAFYVEHCSLGIHHCWMFGFVKTQPTVVITCAYSEQKLQYCLPRPTVARNMHGILSFRFELVQNELRRMNVFVKDLEKGIESINVAFWQLIEKDGAQCLRK